MPNANTDTVRLLLEASRRWLPDFSGYSAPELIALAPAMAHAPRAERIRYLCAMQRAADEQACSCVG